MSNALTSTCPVFKAIIKVAVVETVLGIGVVEGFITGSGNTAAESTNPSGLEFNYFAVEGFNGISINILNNLNVININTNVSGIVFEFNVEPRLIIYVSSN